MKSDLVWIGMKEMQKTYEKWQNQITIRILSYWKINNETKTDLEFAGRMLKILIFEKWMRNRVFGKRKS